MESIKSPFWGRQRAELWRIQASRHWRNGLAVKAAFILHLIDRDSRSLRLWAMSNTDPIELKAYVPAKDFERSKQFYQDLGFTLGWGAEGDLAYFHYGDHGSQSKVGFLLQRFYVKGFAENLMMHLLVKDVDAWWASIQDKKITEKYGVRAEPPEDRPWQMRDFVLIDPSGVLWRIAQEIP